MCDDRGKGVVDVISEMELLLLLSATGLYAAQFPKYPARIPPFLSHLLCFNISPLHLSFAVSEAWHSRLSSSLIKGGYLQSQGERLHRVVGFRRGRSFRIRISLLSEHFRPTLKVSWSCVSEHARRSTSY